MSSSLTRRETLRAAAGGAFAVAIPGLLPGLPLPPAQTPSVPTPPVSPAIGAGLRPELVTVTPHGFAAWWPTDAPADTTVRWWAPGERPRERTLERGQVVHAAEIGGLRPGTEYRYELVSGGQVLRQTLDNPGVLRTLPQPRGRRIARVAVLNDLHVGEGCSGTALTLAGTSVPPCFSAPDYAYRTTRAALAEIRARRPDVVIANGDLTDRGDPDQMRRSLALLRGAGLPLVLTRGNHDRRLRGADGCGPDADCMRTQAFPDHAPYDHVLKSSRRVGRGLTIVGLDCVDPDDGTGRLDLGDQLAFLDRELTIARREGRRALVAFHHPVADTAIATAMPPLVFGVRPDRGQRDALAVLARHPHVQLVLHGHTHRNFVAYDEANPNRLPYLENGATKEYPAGYAILDLHTDGLVRTFHRPTDAFCREWVRTSAGQVWGRQPEYTRGTLESRAFTLTARHRPAPSALGPYGIPEAAS